MDAVNDPLPSLADRVHAPATVERPRDRHDVRWRAIGLDDLDDLTALEIEIGREDHPHYLATREEFEQGLTLSGVELAADTLVAEAPDGTVLAWAHNWLPAGAETVQRVILMGGVRPSARRRGLGAELAAWQVGRGRQQLAATRSTLPGWLLVAAELPGLEVDAVPAVGVFRRHGLEIARYYLGLHRELADPIPVIELDDGLRLEPYRPELAEAVRAAKNDAFRDHWGTQPTTPERWANVVEASVFRADLSFVVLDADGAVAGFVLAEANPDDWPGLGRRSAYISLLGVRRASRGRRIAPALLAATLRAARADGLEIAALDVDFESPTGAVGLYERMGFTEAHRSLNLTIEF